MSAFERPPIDHISLRRQITWLREQIKRDAAYHQRRLQRGQMSPETAAHHERMQRAVLATLEAQALIEYGTARAA